MIVIDILKIGGVDVSDYVLTDGIQLASTPQLHQITDLDGNIHSTLVADKEGLTASLGDMPDSKVKEVRAAISSGDVNVEIFGVAYTMTSMSISRSVSYIYGDVPMWHNVNISGVEA